MELKKKPAINMPLTLNVLDQSEPENGIEVVCRIRPKFADENYVNYQITDKRLDIFEVNTGNEVQNQKSFSFSQLYDQSSIQKNLHQEYVLPLIKDLFEKQRGGLVFTYGVTNSGKTYTIIGTQEAPGILPLTLQTLDKIKTAFLMNKTTIEIDSQVIKINQFHYEDFPLKNIEYTFQSLEIYNEEIYDLLGTQKIKLQLKEIYDKKCYVKDAIEKQINNNQEFKDVLNKALQNRQMGETTLNSQSSRSHTIFKIQVTLTYQGQYTIQKKVTICIVDLAGSERAKKAETQGSQLTEACNINKSLLVLGKCLKQMRCENEADLNNRIPFRECKLTRLLCEYFTEENKILMIVNVKLTKDDIDETLKVLHYGALSVNVNLIKSKIYDSTISFNQRLQIAQQNQMLNDSKGQKQPKRDPIGMIRRLKLVVQNTTKLMLFQQKIQDSFVEEKLQKLKQQQQIQLKLFDKIDDEYLYPQILESDQRLQKSLDKIQSEKRLSRQASLEIEKKHSLTQLPECSTCCEELPQRQSIVYEESQQPSDQRAATDERLIAGEKIVDDDRVEATEQFRKSLAIQEELPKENESNGSPDMEEQCNRISIIEKHIKSYDESEDLLNGLQYLDLEQIDELTDESKQQSKNNNEMKNSNVANENNNDINGRKEEEQMDQQENENRNHFDQATNTTPYDEMKKKIYNQLFDLEMQQNQEEREKFKKNVMKKLFNDEDVQEIIDKENQQDQINLGESAKKLQLKNIEKLISSDHKSGLKVIDESDQEHVSSGEKKVPQQLKMYMKKKKPAKKKGKSKKR